VRTLGAQNTNDHKTKRMGFALKFLTRYAQKEMSFWTTLWLEIKHGVFTTLPLDHQLLRWEIIWRNAPRIWRDFGWVLPLQTQSVFFTVKRARLTGKGSMSIVVLP